MIDFCREKEVLVVMKGPKDRKVTRGYKEKKVKEEEMVDLDYL